jgi:hypothetical protein
MILLTKTVKYIPEEKVHRMYFNMMERLFHESEINNQDEVQKTHWILVKYFTLFKISQECSKRWSVFTVLHLEISRLKIQLA